MSFLFLGGQLDSLLNSGLAETEDTGVGNYNGDFSRGATRISVGSGWAETPAWTAVQELWVHLYWAGDSGFGAQDYMYWQDGATPVLKWHQVTTGVKRISYLSAADTWTQIGPDFTTVENASMDFYFKSGASGEAALYINQIEQWSDTADMSFAGDVTKIRWPSINPRTKISQIAVREESTIGGRVMQGYMTGNGNATTWIGDYTSVDEASLSDVDYIYSGTADQIEQFAHTFVGTYTGYVPRAVCVSARAKRGGSGPQNMQLLLRSGGTDYPSGTKSLGLGYTAVQHIWETNPDTSAAWISSQLTAIQPGVKSIT